MHEECKATPVDAADDTLGGKMPHTKPHPLPYTYKYGVVYICKILNDFDWFFMMWPVMASFKAGISWRHGRWIMVNPTSHPHPTESPRLALRKPAKPAPRKGCLAANWTAWKNGLGGVASGSSWGFYGNNSPILTNGNQWRVIFIRVLEESGGSGWILLCSIYQHCLLKITVVFWHLWIGHQWGFLKSIPFVPEFHWHWLWIRLLFLSLLPNSMDLGKLW